MEENARNNPNKDTYILQFSERELALLNGTLEKPKKREITKLIDKLRNHQLESKARLLRVRYRDLYKDNPLYNDRGLTTYEAQGWNQEFELKVQQKATGNLKCHVNTLPINEPEPENFKTTFSERLKAAMATSKMNPTSLSRASGISYNTIFKYLNGKGTPTPAIGKKMAETMNISEDWLMDKASRGFTDLELVIIYNRLSELDRLRVYGLASALARYDEW